MLCPSEHFLGRHSRAAWASGHEDGLSRSTQTLGTCLSLPWPLSPQSKDSASADEGQWCWRGEDSICLRPAAVIRFAA